MPLQVYVRPAHVYQTKLSALCTAVNRPRQTTCLARKVKLEVEVEDVPERVARNRAHGALSDTRKDCV